mgnify:CR=1 FL=1
MSQEKLDYFISRTDQRLRDMDSKMDKLIGFRWMLLGIASALSAIVSLIIAIYIK